MQVIIFKNVTNERNPSMQLYEEELLKNMPSNVKGFQISTKNLPLLKHYFAKEFIYPKIAANNQADINHIPDHSYCNLLRSLNPKKTIVTCHDLIPLLYPKTVSRAGRMLYSFNIKLLPKAQKIIAVSRFSKETIIQKFGKFLEDRIMVIPNGISEIFRPIKDKEILRAKYKIMPKSILHVGASYRHKNIDIILKFINMHKEYQFVKVGPFLKIHKRYIKMHNLQKQILHFPCIDLAESHKIAEIYNCVGVFVLPSFFEGLGITVVEAMGCGCPVVCSDIPPLHEIAKNAAIFFNPYSQEALKSALGNIFNNEGFRSELIEKGLASAQKYSWKKTAEETYKVYEEVYRQI